MDNKFLGKKAVFFCSGIFYLITLFCNPVRAEDVAMIADINGSVSISLNSSEWAPAIGETLSPDTIIRIPDDGSALLAHFTTNSQYQFTGSFETKVTAEGFDPLQKQSSAVASLTSLPDKLDLSAQSQQQIAGVSGGSDLTQGKTLEVQQQNSFSSSSAPPSPETNDDSFVEPPSTKDLEGRKLPSAGPSLMPPPGPSTGNDRKKLKREKGIEEPRLSDSNSTGLTDESKETYQRIAAVPLSVLSRTFGTDNTDNLLLTESSGVALSGKVINDWFIISCNSTVPSTSDLKIKITCSDSSNEKHYGILVPAKKNLNHAIFALQCESNKNYAAASAIWFELLENKQTKIQQEISTIHLNRLKSKM
ncbi:MAG: hypothetical protein HQM10_18705 [Candidatus Riflebacteria bacterium]|nr:hypothetical protein [Candidatus Riflebacteria bacterium]